MNKIFFTLLLSPVFCFSQKNQTLCDTSFYQYIKSVWIKDSSDGIYRYQPFTNSKGDVKSFFWNKVYNAKDYCIVGSNKSCVVNLFGKPDAVLSDKKQILLYYFIKKEPFDEFLKNGILAFDLYKNKSMVALLFTVDKKSNCIVKFESK